MERMNWLDKLIVAAILILLAALVTDKAEAEPTDIPAMVYDAGEEGMIARFFERPCDDEKIVAFLSAVRPDLTPLHDADSVFRMTATGEWKPYTGCWAKLSKEEVGFEAILFFVEDGDYYVLDKSKFQKGADV